MTHREPNWEFDESRVIYQDNHLIVVDKPSLLATMGGQQGEASLVNLVKHYLKRKFNKPGNVYVGIVSRLDAFTSGVVVLAKTSKAAARLTKQFSQSQVTKRYLAILSAAPNPPQGALSDYLVKNDASRKMVVVTGPEQRSRQGAVPRLAQLQYRLLGTWRGQALVEVFPSTGRKHQIRVQFSHAGTPIVGDKKYGGRVPFARGIALHSQSITIEHPVKKTKMTFVTDVPDYWKIRRFGGKS